ncbi:MAPEG family-domain-containing protein [Pyronema omphalodes]|nr:MAPEG family-domain-containing protein [Pyronema omphalodes]
MSATRSFDFTPAGSSLAGSLGLKLAPTTAIFTLPFSLYLLLLSGRVVAQRQKTGITLGTNASANTETDPLHKAIRAHANYLENVPMAMMLSLVAEINGGSRRCLAWAGATLFALRVANVEFGLRAKDSKGLGRLIGYFGTNAWLAGMAGYCVLLTRDYWGF